MVEVVLRAARVCGGWVGARARGTHQESTVLRYHLGPWGHGKPGKLAAAKLWVELWVGPWGYLENLEISDT